MTRQALAAVVSAAFAVSLARAAAPAPSSNLGITNTDLKATYSAGDALTYTIVVSNAGHDAVIGATVTAAVAALPQVASASWTCVAADGATCTAGPVASDLNDTVDVPKDGKLTYTLVVAIKSDAVGDLVTTAYVTPPAGTLDPYPGNNAAIDADTHQPPVSDLSITSTDGVAFYTAGSSTTYTIVVGNSGPDGVKGATVADAVTALAQVASASWTCVGASGATCKSGVVTGNIVDTVDLPVGGTVTYTLVVKLGPGATSSLVNTATVTPPTGAEDSGPGNNTATDTDAAATIFYVANVLGGGVDSTTCGPSATPCLTIQGAIDKTKVGDTVLVRAGSYEECVLIRPGIGPGGVRVEAEGFFSAGTVGGTILDGTGVCDGDGLPPRPAGPVAQVFDRSTLRGFTITKGGESGVWGFGAVTIANNVMSGNKTSSAGGEIVLLATSLYLTDPLAKAEIKANAILKNTSGSQGAGIYVEAKANGVSSLVEIDGNTVTTSTAGGTMNVHGSGIAVFTDTTNATDSSRVVITGNTVDGNIGTSDGGGIFVATGTGAFNGPGTETVTIGGSKRGNIVRNNVAFGLGGGISVKVQPAASGTHTIDVVANTVTANTGKQGGGGVHLFLRAIDRTPGGTPAVLRASENSIIGNHSQGELSGPNAVGVGGGGIYAELHSDRTASSAVLFTISGNTIESNDATTHGGGASLLASADDDPDTPSTTTALAEAVISFHNNLVAKNAARDMTAETPSGGGVYALAVARGALALARVSQNFLTVADNETELGTGGLQWEDRRLLNSLGFAGAASFELSNSIVTGNDGYGVGFTTPLHPSTTVAVSYTDAVGNPSGNYQAPWDIAPGATGNISVDAELDALFLPRICGPMIDAGDPAIVAAIEPLPNGGLVNLGHLGNTASATRTFPDVNDDHTIDGLDVLGIAVSFNSVGGQSRFLTEADRDLDGDVDGEDLAYVSAFYAQSCP